MLVTDDGIIPARLVIGAEKDFIVDLEGAQETVRYLGIAQGPLAGFVL